MICFHGTQNLQWWPCLNFICSPHEGVRLCHPQHSGSDYILTLRRESGSERRASPGRGNRSWAGADRSQGSKSRWNQNRNGRTREAAASVAEKGPYKHTSMRSAVVRDRNTAGGAPERPYIMFSLRLRYVGGAGDVQAECIVGLGEKKR